MIIAVTGHRPEDCGADEEIVRQKLRDSLDPDNIRTVICGMAAGVDLWAADEALSLGIDVWAARPWRTHAPRWHDVDLYDRIIGNASKIVVVTEADNYPGPWVYQKRNEWMVDNAHRVLAYWSGKESGGTYNCIRYAKKVGVPVRNVY